MQVKSKVTAIVSPFITLALMKYAPAILFVSDTSSVTVSPGRTIALNFTLLIRETTGRKSGLSATIRESSTAPAWTVLFARAAAVVTDGGTLAAHASLVAREYGIPAVVGTGTATALLHTGQLVAVDGYAGTVLPLEQG